MLMLIMLIFSVIGIVILGVGVVGVIAGGVSLLDRLIGSREEL